LIAKILATPAALKVARGGEEEAEPASPEPVAAAAATTGTAEVRDDDLVRLQVDLFLRACLLTVTGL
jgi:hypothetical protein